MFRGEMQTYMLLQRLPSLQRDQSIITYTLTTLSLGIPFLYLSTTSGTLSGINCKNVAILLASPFVTSMYSLDKEWTEYRPIWYSEFSPKFV